MSDNAPCRECNDPMPTLACHSCDATFCLECFARIHCDRSPSEAPHTPPTGVLCKLCKDREATVRCDACAPKSLLCAKCSEFRHKKGGRKSHVLSALPLMVPTTTATHIKSCDILVGDIPLCMRDDDLKDGLGAALQALYQPPIQVISITRYSLSSAAQVVLSRALPDAPKSFAVISSQAKKYQLSLRDSLPLYVLHAAPNDLFQSPAEPQELCQKLIPCKMGFEGQSIDVIEIFDEHLCRVQVRDPRLAETLLRTLPQQVFLAARVLGVSPVHTLDKKRVFSSLSSTYDAKWIEGRVYVLPKTDAVLTPTSDAELNKDIEMLLQRHSDLSLPRFRLYLDSKEALQGHDLQYFLQLAKKGSFRKALEDEIDHKVQANIQIMDDDGHLPLVVETEYVDIYKRLLIIMGSNKLRTQEGIQFCLRPLDAAAYRQSKMQTMEYIVSQVQDHDTVTNLLNWSIVADFFSEKEWAPDKWLAGFAHVKDAPRGQNGPKRAYQKLVGASTLHSVCKEKGYTVGDQRISIDTSFEEIRRYPALHSQGDAKLDNIARQPSYAVTKVVVRRQDCLSCASQLLSEQEGKVCVLNLANEKEPGGGFLRGASAQEENLFRRTTLCAMSAKTSSVHQNYPLAQFGALYTEGVTVLRGPEAEGYPFLPKPFRINVIAAAAVNQPKLKHSNREILDDQEARVMFKKIVAILQVAANENQRTLVLGALGCGAFRHPAKHVAQIFHEALILFAGYFDAVYFPIIEDQNSNGVNFSAFNIELNMLHLKPVKDSNPPPLVLSQASPTPTTLPRCHHTTALCLDNPTHKLLLQHATSEDSVDPRARAKEDDKKDGGRGNKCSQGTTCPLFADEKHVSAFVHPFKIPCTFTPYCSRMEDEAHMRAFSHVCPGGHHCKDLKNKKHCSLFIHAQPSKCKDGTSCSQLDQDDHLNLFSHSKVKITRTVCQYGEMCRSADDPKHLCKYTHTRAHLPPSFLHYDDRDDEERIVCFRRNRDSLFRSLAAKHHGSKVVAKTKLVSWVAQQRPVYSCDKQHLKTAALLGSLVSDAWIARFNDPTVVAQVIVQHHLVQSLANQHTDISFPTLVAFILSNDDKEIDDEKQAPYMTSLRDLVTSLASVCKKMHTSDASAANLEATLGAAPSGRRHANEVQLVLNRAILGHPGSFMTPPGSSSTKLHPSVIGWDKALAANLALRIDPQNPDQVTVRSVETYSGEQDMVVAICHLPALVPMHYVQQIVSPSSLDEGACRALKKLFGASFDGIIQTKQRIRPLPVCGFAWAPADAHPGVLPLVVDMTQDVSYVYFQCRASSFVIGLEGVFSIHCTENCATASTVNPKNQLARVDKIFAGTCRAADYVSFCLRIKSDGKCRLQVVGAGSLFGSHPVLRFKVSAKSLKKSALSVFVQRFVGPCSFRDMFISTKPATSPGLQNLNLGQTLKVTVLPSPSSDKRGLWHRMYDATKGAIFGDNNNSEPDQETETKKRGKRGTRSRRNRDKTSDSEDDDDDDDDEKSTRRGGKKFDIPACRYGSDCRFYGASLKDSFAAKHLRSFSHPCRFSSSCDRSSKRTCQTLPSIHPRKSSCMYGAKCPDLKNPQGASHRERFSHPGERDFLLLCKDGMDCSEQNDRAHFAVYKHTPTSLSTTKNQPAWCVGRPSLPHPKGTPPSSLVMTPLPRPANIVLTDPLLALQDSHYRYAESQFRRLFGNAARLSNIEYVSNPPLEQKFNALFTSQSTPPRVFMCFHGTPAANVPSICANGFQVGGQGVPVANGTALGSGVYTSEDPNMASGYARGGNKLLFVLVMDIPGTVNNNTVHVSPNPVAVLPRYVITM